MREILWERLGNVWRPRHMDAIITNEVKLDDLGDAFDVMMKGGSLGRTVVDLS
jgi:Zn-dependent alcohol dehydrogenase